MNTNEGETQSQSNAHRWKAASYLVGRLTQHHGKRLHPVEWHVFHGHGGNLDKTAAAKEILKNCP